MKIEVRQCKAGEKVAAGELHLALWKLEDDRAVLRAGELLSVNALQESNCLADALLQLREGRLRIRHARRLDPGEPRRAALGGIAYDLNLPGKGVHVGRKARFEQRVQTLVFGFRLRH